ncbi:MAG: class I SAM-dependent methyltransferase [Candidatus Buchananbacteria bacterium]|nr:class I SAM-dependent methyltransferase [Candidatus Buchananbacteria bacterium]
MIVSDKERQAPLTVQEAEPSHLARYQFALSFVKNTDRVLDVPCGSGYGTNLLATKAKTATGIDIHPGAIQHAQEFFAAQNINFLVADMQTIEASFSTQGTFDLITSFEGIEHIEKQEEFLAGISKLLTDDGYLIISTPRKPHGSPYHTVEFSLEAFKEILSKNFVIEKMFGQIYTDIFDLATRAENPADYHRFNFIALCRPR